MSLDTRKWKIALETNKTLRKAIYRVLEAILDSDGNGYILREKDTKRIAIILKEAIDGR